MSTISDLVESQLAEVGESLAKAEIALIEMNAAAEELRTENSRLKAALAALNGEIPGNPVNAENSADNLRKPAKQEPEIHNPLAHLKCNGCGTEGSLEEHILTTGAGGIVRSMVCRECNNQMIMG
jgi:hypothetical protein